MFADEGNAPETEIQDEEDETDAYGKLKKKKVNFVDYKTIEGQELSDSERERDIEDELESVPSSAGVSDDEENGKKILDDEDAQELGIARSNQKIKMEKFNLRQEQAEGMFTEDGTFVRKAVDPRAHQDKWLDGITKGTIKRAREGMERQQRREREFEERERQDARVSPSERLDRLIRYLKPKETPLDVLARLNTAKKKKWQPSQKWKKSKMAVDAEQSTNDEDTTSNKELIEDITKQADVLLNLGNQTIYSTTRERLIMLYQEDTGERFREDPNANGVVQWEYKWPGGDDVYSGYAASDMQSWKEGGFFGDGVLCRPMGSDGEWKSSTEINF
jgi:CD2 antigen cytoplasmic tail-binding protein 2